MRLFYNLKMIFKGDFAVAHNMKINLEGLEAIWPDGSVELHEYDLLVIDGNGIAVTA